VNDDGYFDERVAATYDESQAEDSSGSSGPRNST
jgi:hypothetical protein